MCNRCGMTGHQVRTCCTIKYFVNLYQTSLRNKRKRGEIYSTKNALERDIEVNTLVEENPLFTLIEAKAKTLEVTNFLEDGKEQSPDWWKNVQT